MTEFERQFQEVKELLHFNDFNQTIKRVIDFTLDTENIQFYLATNDFLLWNDQNENNEIEKKEKLSELLTNIHSFLSKKDCHNHETIISVRNLQKVYNANFGLGPINLDIKTGEIKKWQNSFNYKEYNNYITRKLDELGITLEFRKRKFDHFVWFNNRA